MEAENTVSTMASNFSNGKVCEMHGFERGMGVYRYDRASGNTPTTEFLTEIDARFIDQSWACKSSIQCYTVMLSPTVSCNEMIKPNRNDYSNVLKF